MKNIKKITILLCFLSLLAFISCNNESSTGSGVGGGSGSEAGGGSGTGSDGGDNSGENGTSGNGTTSGSGGQTASSSYVGNWYDASDNTPFMTVNSDGSITIDSIGKVTNITKKSDTNFVMYYEESSARITYDINFSSSSNGTAVITTAYSGTQSGKPSTINIIKK